MSPDRVLEGVFIIGTILLLLLVGAVIALRSGISEVTSGKDYLRIAGNLSGILLRIACYVGVLLAVQHMIGLRPSLGW
jgi:hypothetical protein